MFRVRPGILTVECRRTFCVIQYISGETLLVSKTGLGNDVAVENSRCVNDNNYNKPLAEVFID